MEQTKTYQNVVFAEHVHKTLLEGAEILANAVKSTMGPSGHGVIIDQMAGPPMITKDGVTVAKSINLKNRLQSMGAELLKEVASKTNEMAGDGPQPKYAKVLTPDGWTTMGQLKIGDTICGTNGTFQKVLGVFDKGKKDIYRVALSDGNSETRFVECSEDHLWSVKTYFGSSHTITTKQMLNSGLKRPAHGWRYFVPTGTVEFTDNTNNLPLDPYLLGVLLGDGSLSTNHDIEIAIGLNEEHILDKILLPENCKITKTYYSKKHYIRATISGAHARKGTRRGERTSILKCILHDLKLLGTNSHTKFIPKQYLYSSVKNRKKLLNGLIDTDGHINQKGLFEFSTVSKQLYLDFVELCRSLGKQVHARKKERKANSGSYSNKPIYVVSELKGHKYGIKIKDIKKTDKKTEMMCIKVSNEDNLYITDDYVPTHNTSTSVLLAYTLLKEGIKRVSSNHSSLELKQGMEIGLESILHFLENNCVQIDEKDDIINVGSISANGDRAIGELIADAIEKVGKDGIVTIEPAKSVQTTLDIVKGFQIDNGYLSPYFITNADKASCELEDPYILVTSSKITSIADILRVLEEVAKTNKPLLVIGDEVEGEALHTLIVNKMNGTLNSCAVKAPSYGEFRAELLEDIGVVTGATVIGDGSEIALKKAGTAQLGRAKKVIVTRNSCVIVGQDNEDKQQEIQSRVADIRKVLETDDTLDELRVNKYRQRLAKLSGGIAVIKVGGSTELEISEKKDRVEDAVNATMAATQEGIVAGGGTALFYAAQELKALIKAGMFQGKSEDIIAGIDLLASVCESPLRTIVENSGASYEVVSKNLRDNLSPYKPIYVDVSDVASYEELESEFNKIQSKLSADYREESGQAKEQNYNFGYNALKHEYMNLVEGGVLDPVKVTRLCLEHSVSVVGLMLSCNALVVHEDEQEE